MSNVVIVYNDTPVSFDITTASCYTVEWAQTTEAVK